MFSDPETSRKMPTSVRKDALPQNHDHNGKQMQANKARAAFNFVRVSRTPRPDQVPSKWCQDHLKFKNV